MIRIFMIGFSNNKGGVEAYITNLCSNLDNSKFEVVYCLPEMNIGGKQWICPPNRHNYIKYVLFWKTFYRENYFDVLYFNTCDIVSIDQLRFAKEAGIPVRIIHSHNTGNQQGIHKKMNLFHRYAEKQNRKHLHQYATRLLACSATAGDWMFDGRSYQIIKNGIHLPKYQYDNEKRTEIRKKNGYKEDILVGVIGRLDSQKNPFFAVNILEKLLQQKNMKAVFIGDGEHRIELQNRVKNAGLEQKIQFVGAVDNVYEWMSAIDCLLMPSLFEGLPFVLVEAQAAGLPCVVSSTVSGEANITGLVTYVALEDDIEVWVNIINECVQCSRKNTEKMLIDAGYSTLGMARTVSEIIENEIRKIYGR